MDPVFKRERRRIIGRFESEDYVRIFRDTVKYLNNDCEVFVVNEYNLYRV
nr:MAG TPA: hypothetical protein [Caudoviricetes sp.]